MDQCPEGRSAQIQRDVLQSAVHVVQRGRGQKRREPNEPRCLHHQHAMKTVGVPFNAQKPPCHQPPAAKEHEVGHGTEEGRRDGGERQSPHDERTASRGAIDQAEGDEDAQGDRHQRHRQGEGEAIGYQPDIFCEQPLVGTEREMPFPEETFKEHGPHGPEDEEPQQRGH